MTELRIGAHEQLRVVRSDAEVFEVEARYEPHGNRPPPHLHPGQDEQFTIVEGSLHVELDRRPIDLGAGDELTVLPGHVHCMWNTGDVPAVVQWRTTPALGTEDWFRGLDALQRAAERAGKTRPDLLGFAAHARRHRDTFRLVLAGSRLPGDLVVGLLALVARVSGRAR